MFLVKQKGLSLVELMVAMLLGLVLMAGVLQVFLASKRTYTYQTALSRVQENGRIAQEFFSRDIRMAGYTGCASGSYGALTNTLNQSTLLDYDFSTGVQGYDVGSSTPSALSAVLTPLANTDVLVLRGPVGSGVKIVQNNSGAQLFAESTGDDGKSGISVGDILMVSDCTKSRVFQATTVQPSGGLLNISHAASSPSVNAVTIPPGNAIVSWGGASGQESERFGTDAEVIKISTIYYFIGSGASGQPALFQKIVPGKSEEILEGVENMQILYGRDTNGDKVPDSYATATTIGTNWSQVVSVRVQLLVRSTEDAVVDAPQAYSFNGASVTPTDRRLRQVFVSTTGLRSRIP